MRCALGTGEDVREDTGVSKRVGSFAARRLEVRGGGGGEPCYKAVRAEQMKRKEQGVT